MYLSAILMLATLSLVNARPYLYPQYPYYYNNIPMASLDGSMNNRLQDDIMGQYSYGYNDVHGKYSKYASKSLNEIKKSPYMYLSPNDITRDFNHLSNLENGFRITQAIPPVDMNQFNHIMMNPYEDSIQSRDIKLENSEQINENATLIKNDTNVVELEPEELPNFIETINDFQPYEPSVPLYYTNPVPVVQPLDTVLPVYGHHSQYHTQDGFGQYSYGYSGGPSSKMEMRTADGITRGGYSYVDANGILQKVNYISDPVNGFRVSGTNLPLPNMPTYTPYYQPIFSDINHISHINQLDMD